MELRYPALPRLHPAVVPALAAELHAHARATPEQQLPPIVAQLAALLAHAQRHSPRWRERLGAGIAGGGAATPDALLAALPVLRRDDLQSAPLAEWRAREPGWTDQDVDEAHTSGSTGKPVVVERLLPLHGLLFEAAAQLDQAWHGVDVRGKLAVIRGNVDDGTAPGWSVAPQAASRPTGPCVLRHSEGRSVQELWDWLLEQAPDYLVTNASLAHALALQSIDCGLRIGSLRGLLCFGERIRPEIRAAVALAFGLPAAPASINAPYSCQEAGWIALQCPRHAERLHVVAPLVWVEIVDEDGQPCPVGVPGRVLISVLHSYAMPLLRYELGDLAQWALPPGSPCDCGCRWPTIEPLWGRVRSVARLPDGRLVFVRFASRDWDALGVPVREYRLVQYRDGAIDLFLNTAKPLPEPAQARARAIVQRLLGWPFDVRVVVTADIPWQHPWKREDFIRVDAERPDRVVPTQFAASNGQSAAA